MLNLRLIQSKGLFAHDGPLSGAWKRSLRVGDQNHLLEDPGECRSNVIGFFDHRPVVQSSASYPAPRSDIERGENRNGSKEAKA